MFSWQSRFATVDYPPRKEQGNLTLQFSKSVFRFHPRGRYRLSTLPLLPRFGIDCNPRHSFPFLSSPPPPFPDISYRAVSWKGRFYIFLVDSLPRIIWLDAILNCAFPIILSRLWYSMRNACSLLSPPPPPSGVHERLSMEIFGELKSRYYTFWRRRIYLNLLPFNKAIRIREYIEKLRRFLRSR